MRFSKLIIRLRTYGLSLRRASRALAMTTFVALRVRVGGADRDRTDDLKLAKLALSQLSYGPDHNLWLHNLLAADGGPGTS